MSSGESESETDFFIRTDMTPVGSRYSVGVEIQRRIRDGVMKFSDLPPGLRVIYAALGTAP